MSRVLGRTIQRDIRYQWGIQLNRLPENLLHITRFLLRAIPSSMTTRQDVRINRCPILALARTVPMQYPSRYQLGLVVHSEQHQALKKGRKVIASILN